MIAVVGCGHSGTFHISEVFQRIGVDIRHEQVGRDGVAGWNYTHLLREQFPDFGLPVNAVVLHQTRHPLRVISSLQAMEDDTWEEVGRRAACRGIEWNPLEYPHPVRGMEYWVYWNRFAEGIAQYQYRVENLPVAFPEILHLLGLPVVALPRVPKTMNKHEYSYNYEWSDLEVEDSVLCERVRQMSVEYGYER